MSGECNVCGQTGHVEIEHCCFKDEMRELEAELEAGKEERLNFLRDAYKEAQSLWEQNKQLQAENERLKEALTQMDNNAFAIRLTYEQALQGQKGMEK